MRDYVFTNIFQSMTPPCRLERMLRPMRIRASTVTFLTMVILSCVFMFMRPPIKHHAPILLQDEPWSVAEESVATRTRKQWVDASKKKIILFWTPFFGGQNSFLGEEGKKIKDCPINTCIFTDNRTMVNKSDALIFHPLDMSSEDLPGYRNPDQYYIYFVLESPPHAPPGPPEFFNLSFTYRLDSDIVADNYMQYFRPSLWTSKRDFDTLWKTKRNLAAMFSSNCAPPSNRHQYVSLLQKDFPVDIYGACGSKKCPKDREEACNKLIGTYKFYLAFENSICRDYVSEKIIRAFNSGAVPIVMGGANYSAIFPPNSVINVMDFESPKKLADYLWLLAASKKAYSKHFKWRYNPAHVKMPKHLRHERVSLCKLCELLHTQPKIRKTYPSNTFAKWWSDDAKCYSPDWIPTLKSPSQAALLY